MDKVFVFMTQIMRKIGKSKAFVFRSMSGTLSDWLYHPGV